MTLLIKFCVILILCWAAFAEAKSRVLGVYFVESDKRPNLQQQKAVLTQLLRIQKAFLENFGSTFELADPPVTMIRGNHSSRYYTNTRTPPGNGNTNDPRWYWLDNMREEIVRKLRLRADVRIVNYPTTKMDGRVGAFLNLPVGQGAYMDFDDLTCVYGGGESTPFPGGVESVCTAHELHELEHIFGLQHQGPVQDCMQQGFYKQSAPSTGLCKFSQSNRDIVRRTQKAWLTQAKLPARPCTYSDSCDSTILLSGFPGRIFRDSCGESYKISSTCSLIRRCVFTDACKTSRKLKGFPGQTIRDSCDRSYRISNTCTLTQV